MSKLKFSFLVLMLMVSVSASADWAPADVQAALKKMYPTADGVAWSHDESYYVADFLMNGFDTKVWFDGQYAEEPRILQDLPKWGRERYYCLSSGNL